MDTIEFIRQLLAGVRRQTDESMKDMTVEQFNWTPPERQPDQRHLCALPELGRRFRANSNAGETKAVGRGGWAEKTGVKVPPGYSGGWEEVKNITLALEPILAYQQVVRAATQAFLDSLTRTVSIGW